MTVLNVLDLRLRSMYVSISIRSLSITLLVLIGILISGLYSGAQDSTRLKIGVLFEKETELTEAIYAALSDNEIIKPIKMTREEGLQAVTEGRIQGLFVFKEEMEEEFADGNHEETVDLYLLDENFMPYLLADIVGSEMIGELSVLRAITYMEEALDETGVDVGDRESFLEGMYVFGKSDMDVEKDNFYVEKTYVIPDESKDLSYVALENVLLFKQVILGVVYIFVAFYMMFLVVNMVRDDETGLRPKWLTTPMGRLQIITGEYLSVVVGSMPVLIVMTLIQSLFETRTSFFAVTNLLYALAYAGLLMLCGKIFRKVTVYVVATSALIIILGIVSGSFFLIDTTRPLMKNLTYMIPTYHLLGEVVRVKLIEATWPSMIYSVYMLLYSAVTFGLSYMLESVRNYHEQ